MCTRGYSQADEVTLVYLLISKLQVPVLQFAFVQGLVTAGFTLSFYSDFCVLEIDVSFLFRSRNFHIDLF